MRSGQAGARLGFALVGAGDVNGDGFSDVAVSAYLFDAGKTDEGRVFVFAGSPEGLSKTPSWIMDGNQADGHFGRALACAGDVNGDGFDDLIVGARVMFAANATKALLYFQGWLEWPCQPRFLIGEGNRANASYLCRLRRG